MAERGRPRSFDRRQALYRAMEVFWEKGYEGASMAALTDAMGIAAPSLYAAFGSKEALFREALGLYETTEGGELMESVLRASTAFEAVQRLLMASARLYTRADKPAGCLVVLCALQAGDAGEPVRGELSSRRMANVGSLAELLARGVDTGEIPPSADLRAIARFYVTVQQGMSIQARDGASQSELETVARAALSAWAGLIGR
ncbi:TetR/AcrR family transcriptional regulator [Bordetella genomosp. 13]|uniref:TetR family transcriptional regulator n=1 Tax=Bordetella genomosp. 13 TaxID=463040 RepID=A0A1W6ZJ30_9BORD|nr:TetR/AcrR family transcriptional regulator [Bordetella genomosp. 13]ARP97329.1 TetR family transcriptional regulator [Bordetella genomosp. 13]